MIKINPLTLSTGNQVKRYIQDPNISTLNGGQAEAMKLFKQFSQLSRDRYFILEGWAGTGKTYLGSTLIEWLLWDTLPRPNIAMTAPVNDAVKVLRNSAEFIDDHLHYGTLHSLLSMKAKRDNKTGELKFVYDASKKCVLDECDYLVIDEGSMLQDELFHIINTHFVETGSLRVIILGDGGQIPPIGQDFSIPFSQEGRETYNMWFYELTQIVRQSEGNPIIQFTTGLRKNLNKPVPIVLFNNSIQDGKGLLFLNSKHQKELVQTIRALFTSEYFKENPNYVKIVCWRNSVVRSFNNLVRSMLFGREIPKLVVGEKMVASEAIMNGYESVLISNGTKFEILELTIEIAYPVQGGPGYKYYDTLVKIEEFQDTEPIRLKIIHEESEEPYNEYLKKVHLLCKGEPDGQLRMKLFNSYYNLKRFFASVEYNYAITAHRSQGSTYQYVLVIMEDIYQNHGMVKVRDRNRIGYTACTRPSDMLIMVGDL